MPQLQEFNFSANLLTTEQVAWIVANRPDLKGWSLCAAQINTFSVNSVEKNGYVQPAKVSVVSI